MYNCIRSQHFVARTGATKKELGLLQVRERSFDIKSEADMFHTAESLSLFYGEYLYTYRELSKKCL